MNVVTGYFKNRSVRFISFLLCVIFLFSGCYNVAAPTNGAIMYPEQEETVTTEPKDSSAATDSTFPLITVPNQEETAPAVTLPPVKVPTQAPTQPPIETDAPITPETIPATEPSQSDSSLMDSFSDTGDDILNIMCDQILLNVLKTEMTQKEKAYAIYKWVIANVRYLGVSDTSDWIEGAKYALKNKKGNCYAFYSSSRALLTRAGFENIEAVSTSKGHYWNIVQVDGQWRHFDTTPGWGTERFLWTGTQILQYRYYSEKYQYYISYLWNPEGYPDTD